MKLSRPTHLSECQGSHRSPSTHHSPKWGSFAFPVQLGRPLRGQTPPRRNIYLPATYFLTPHH